MRVDVQRVVLAVTDGGVKPLVDLLHVRLGDSLDDRFLHRLACQVVAPNALAALVVADDGRVDAHAAQHKLGAPLRPGSLDARGVERLVLDRGGQHPEGPHHAILLRGHGDWRVRTTRWQVDGAGQVSRWALGAGACGPGEGSGVRAHLRCGHVHEHIPALLSGQSCARKLKARNHPGLAQPIFGEGLVDLDGPGRAAVSAAGLLPVVHGGDLEEVAVERHDLRVAGEREENVIVGRGH
mmetsp:Transcript_7675/g.20134  ORF Transcript_7675/g.20134 Transcript_7675/m.20134 type:complete len:239 (+) Transcript_7675:320-1036(+)